MELDFKMVLILVIVDVDEIEVTGSGHTSYDHTSFHIFVKGGGTVNNCPTLFLVQLLKIEAPDQLLGSLCRFGECR